VGGENLVVMASFDPRVFEGSAENLSCSLPVFGVATRLPPPPQEFGKGSLLRLDLRRRGLVMARRQ
jgi:hypothetical protein